MAEKTRFARGSDQPGAPNDRSCCERRYFLVFCAEQEETHKKLKINTNGGNLRAAYARPTDE